MDFKKIILALSLIQTLFLIGCVGYRAEDKTADNIIGNPTQNVTSLHTPDEGEFRNIVLFDKVVRRIHQFDLTNMQHVRSFAVRNPSAEHFVLYGQNGDYIIDLSTKGLSIFDKNGQANHQPIQYLGTPQSAAFLPSKGLLVVYDDLTSVGLLKLDNQGKVLGTWVGGSTVVDIRTIAAGDLNEDGKLVLALNTGQIVVVDPEKSIAQKTWVVESTFNTELSDIKWVAPLPKSPHLVFLRAAGTLALIDLNLKAQISSYTVADEIVKLSKLNDPHVVMESGNAVKIAYVEESQIKEKTFYIGKTKYFEMKYLMSSNLDLDKDTWSFVDTTENVNYFFNDLDKVQKGRRFIRYRFSDSLALYNVPVANDTQVEIAENFIFSLFPRELGYALRYDLETEHQSSLERFNLKYIPAD
ncbi:MAG: hypothetical protein ACXWRE_15515 [Pseudobdellovibrionaceae bacterium]